MAKVGFGNVRSRNGNLGWSASVWGRGSFPAAVMADVWGDKPQCSLNPSHKDTYSNGIVNSPMELQIFETDITHDREDFFALCFFVREARGHVRSQCKKACAYDVRKALIRDLLISIHKTRGFEWQTAHTKGCLENRCVVAFLLN